MYKYELWNFDMIKKNIELKKVSFLKFPTIKSLRIFSHRLCHACRSAPGLRRLRAEAPALSPCILKKKKSKNEYINIRKI